jgi:hypothetical protein
MVLGAVFNIVLMRVLIKNAKTDYQLVLVWIWQIFAMELGMIGCRKTLRMINPMRVWPAYAVIGLATPQMFYTFQKKIPLMCVQQPMVAMACSLISSTLQFVNRCTVNYRDDFLEEYFWRQSFDERMMRKRNFHMRQNTIQSEIQLEAIEYISIFPTAALTYTLSFSAVGREPQWQNTLFNCCIQFVSEGLADVSSLYAGVKLNGKFVTMASKTQKCFSLDRFGGHFIFNLGIVTIFLAAIVAYFLHYVELFSNSYGELVTRVREA